MSFKVNTRALAVAVTLAVAAGGVASPAAAGVVVFSNVKGVWSNPAPASGVSIANGAPTSTISWGTGTKDGNYNKSNYKFTGIGAVTPDLDDGESAGPFALGEFQHNNWPITGTSLSSVKLAFQADITIDGNSIGTKTFDFLFTHDETPNEGDKHGNCKYGGKTGSGINLNGCADKVEVNTNSLNNVFTFGADTYKLEIAGFFAGGVLTEDFLTKESTKKKVYDNKAKIMGKVSMVTSAVPEPSTWAMMIVGFGAVGAMVRSNRRRLAVAA